MIKEIENIYNTNAERYKQETKNFEFPVGVFEYFVSQLPGKKVLDLWCGYWREVSRLRNMWYEAKWIDISQWLIDIADTNTQKYLQYGDITKLHSYYSSEVFDGIISSASLVHMPHTDWIQVMSDVYDILSKSGILFLSLKVDAERKTIHKTSISTPWVTKKYVYYGEKEIETILSKIWFSILMTHSWKPKGDTWKIIIAKK